MAMAVISVTAYFNDDRSRAARNADERSRAAKDADDRSRAARNADERTKKKGKTGEFNLWKMK